MPSVYQTIRYLLKIKINPNLEGIANYKNFELSFYPNDMSAILEVLFDKEYKFLKPLIKDIKEPVILDIGGNIGTFSIWVFGENKNAHILSIEPSNNTFKTLSKNVVSAKEQGFSWNCKKRAAWKNNDLIAFATDGDSMGHKVSDKGNDEIKGITLNEIISEHLKKTNVSKIDLLKIDIEGAEESFLCDNDNNNKQQLEKVERLVIELHANYCDAEKVHNFLKTVYKNIDNQTDRVSQKPLLYCYN